MVHTERGVIIFDGVGVTTDDGVRLLHDVNLTIDAPRTAIIGANGSGKTTLARLCNGLTTPTTGVVTVDGRSVAASRRDVQRDVGFVFANADHQLVYPTPLEDVMLSLRARGVRTSVAREAARRQLTDLGLEDKADQGIHTLSGGEKHLAALAAVLVLEPRWLVVDEPTTTLDLPNRTRVISVLQGLPQRVIVVTHDLELARTLPRTVVIADGTVVADGPSDQTVERYVAMVGG